MSASTASQVQVVLYTTGWCPYCERARALLRARDVSFHEINVEAQPEQRAEMLRRSGGRRSVPQIFIGERYIGGSDDLYALDAAGGLEPLLQGH